MNTINTIINKINLMSPQNAWAINFQDPASPIAERIIEIHNYVFFFLTVVLIFVSYHLYRILATFWWAIPDNVAYTKKDLNVIKTLSQLRFTHNATIEIIWTVIPSLILVAIAIPSFGLLYAMDDVIDPDLTVKIVGHQWYWSYEYTDNLLVDTPEFKISFDSYMTPENELVLGTPRLLEVDNSLYLPIGNYIRLNVTSADVLHCWAVPSLGVKVDAVPHRINTTLVYINRTGVFYGQCSEICGVNHGFMPIKVVALFHGKEDMLDSKYYFTDFVRLAQFKADLEVAKANPDFKIDLASENPIKSFLTRNQRYSREYIYYIMLHKCPWTWTLDTDRALQSQEYMENVIDNLVNTKRFRNINALYDSPEFKAAVKAYPNVQNDMYFSQLIAQYESGQTVFNPNFVKYFKNLKDFRIDTPKAFSEGIDKPIHDVDELYRSRMIENEWNKVVFMSNILRR